MENKLIIGRWQQKGEAKNYVCEINFYITEFSLKLINLHACIKTVCGLSEISMVVHYK